jgi:hypothetical protein
MAYDNTTGWIEPLPERRPVQAGKGHEEKGWLPLRAIPFRYTICRLPAFQRKQSIHEAGQYSLITQIKLFSTIL